MTVTSEQIARWSSHIRPFPLPEYLAPSEPGCMSEISDDALMNAPPQLIAHVQRTASQGGLQVISPRQTPISWLMIRTETEDRRLGDHIVGSTAEEELEWPTIDDTDFDWLLPDEPLHRVDEAAMTKEKTRTEPLTRAGNLLKDPILTCLVKGRATIDVLDRDDVAGGAQEMAELLASAWGVPEGSIMDMDAFTIGFDGPLLRHAIKSDEVFPMVHAPVHRKKVVSVGASEISRELLPFDTAMDWRRMRTFCEAVFLMSCSVEGRALRDMRVMPPPGDPTAPGDRPGVLSFTPAPCTAWTFSADTFSVCPIPPPKAEAVSMGSIPQEVMAALARYVDVVRPVSHAMVVGHRPVARTTLMIAVDMPLEESITSSYRQISHGIFTGTARGRTSTAAVRNAIYEAIEAAPMPTRLKLARYIYITGNEWYEHFGSRDVPDLVIDKVASRFLTVGELIRLKVAAEAVRRGYTIEQWWEDITSQAPKRYMALTEGTMGWAKIGMWLTFRQPTERWTKMVKAINYQALREAEAASVGAVPLPPIVGSMERLLAATRYTASAVTKAYAGYYSGVADIGIAMADVALEMGHERTSHILRESAYLWMLRSRCLRGTNVNVIASTEAQKSINYYRIQASPVDLLIVPAPYRAYRAYTKHASESPLLPCAIKKTFSEFTGTRISQVFQGIKRPLVAVRETLLTRYLVKPSRLGDDMERAWRELTQDIRGVASKFGSAAAVEKKRKKDEDIVYIPTEQLGPIVRRKVDHGPRQGYFDIYGSLTQDEVDWIDNMMDKLPESSSDQIMEGTYANKLELTSLIMDHERMTAIPERHDRESVR